MMDKAAELFLWAYLFQQVLYLFKARLYSLGLWGLKSCLLPYTQKLWF